MLSRRHPRGSSERTVLPAWISFALKRLLSVLALAITIAPAWVLAQNRVPARFLPDSDAPSLGEVCSLPVVSDDRKPTIEAAMLPISSPVLPPERSSPTSSSVPRLIDGAAYAVSGGEAGGLERAPISNQNRRLARAAATRKPDVPRSLASFPGGTKRYFFYNPEMNLIAESDLTIASAPPIAYEYIWFNGHPVAQVDGGVVTHWTFTDHLGTPTIQTDSSGAPYWRAEYEPYGSVFALRTADQHQPLRLPGQEAEQLNLGANGTTEREYNIFRWYRGNWGRYSQSDPISGPDDPGNPYSYVNDGPLDGIDPLGLFAELLCRKVYANGLPAIQSSVVRVYGPIHCRLHVRCDGYDKTIGQENLGSVGIQPTITDYSPADYLPPWFRRPVNCGDVKCPSCINETCMLKEGQALQRRPYLVPPYQIFPGPNSNTFAAGLIGRCGCKGAFPFRANGSGY